MTITRLVAAALLMLAWWLLCCALGRMGERAFQAKSQIRRRQP